MSTDFYCTREIKKTRKKHWCTGCLEDIETGSPAVYVSCVFDNDFGTYYLCPACHAYMQTDEWLDDRYPGDYWNEGDVGISRRGERDEV